MRLGLFGGTFNPIHIGHLRVAEEVRDYLSLDKVIFIPSYMPPHKELSENVEGKKRLAAVKLAVNSNPYFEVSSFEVDCEGNSYSIKTIDHMRSKFNCTPYFILGQDAFNDIACWHRAEELFSLSHFVVMSRPDTPRQELEKVFGDISASFRKTLQGYISASGIEIIYVDVTAYAVSSTKIRELCKKKKSIRYLVPDEVHEYIENERIYT